jgi:(p)ppGpp synthase/HD superfamily hydrolase
MKMNEIMRITAALDFAAQTHVKQKRKGEAGEPYVNHLSDVANRLAIATEGTDADLVMAGLLHDTVEDQGVTYAELEQRFGKDVADLVHEVTDDKRLPKAERKQLQIETAPTKSARAKMLKIADKTSNLKAVLVSPPSDWSMQRKQDYFVWAAQVVAGCRGVNAILEAEFDAAYRAGVDTGLVGGDGNG